MRREARAGRPGSVSVSPSVSPAIERAEKTATLAPLLSLRPLPFATSLNTKCIERGSVHDPKKRDTTCFRSGGCQGHPGPWGEPLRARPRDPQCWPHSLSPPPALSLPTFSPQALQLKMAMAQVWVGQGSGEVQGCGLGSSADACLPTRRWSRCETPEAR